MKSKTNGLRGLVAGLAGAVIMSANMPASAWCVYNNTRYSLRCEVYGGDWDVTIPAYSNLCCNYANTDCNPGGNRYTARTLQFRSVDGSTLDFLGVVSMQAGGWAEIHEEAHGWLGPVNLFGMGYDVDGTLRGVTDNGNNATNRDVRFLVSADCQYNNADGQYGGGSATANAVNSRMINMVTTQGDLRGIVYAGDLTQNTRRYDEFDWYHDSISGFSRFVYDGLGNHDEAQATVGQQFACAFETNECVDPGYFRETIRDRRHATTKINKGDPHYSWDWHDVHLVQLNLFPGNSTAPQFPDLSPHNALAFLQADLALFAGATKRPVVLFHHYGFDSFSTNSCGGCDEEWWTEAHRVAYWNAIAPYNVVGIFCGHLHLGPNSPNWRVDWYRPAGASGGPDSIPTFVSGAARNGAFLDVSINPVGQVTVTRRDQNGTMTDQSCHASNNTMTVDRDYTGWGEGTYVRPYANLTQAVNVLAARNPSCAANLSLDVRDGSYTDTFTLSTPVVIRSVGGPARMGTGH